LNNDEIRLAILCEYYNAIHSEKSYGNVRDITELQGVNSSVLNANLVYLIDKDLMLGETYYTSGGIHASGSRITARGIDIVEEIVKQSENKVDPKISDELKKKSVTAEKVLKFTELCVKAASMCQTAVNVAHGIFTGL